MKWFARSWWKYLLDVGSLQKPRIGWPGWRKLLCRARGHPFGVWWYTLSRLEPDMRCRNCGDDLG